MLANLLRSNIDDEVYVQRIERGGSAEAGGVIEGDVVQAINGLDITGKTARDVAPMVAGPDGSTLLLVILRGPTRKRFALKVIRTLLSQPSSGASTPTRASSDASITSSTASLPVFRSPQENHVSQKTPSPGTAGVGIGIMLQVFAKIEWLQRCSPAKEVNT